MKVLFRLAFPKIYSTLRDKFLNHAHYKPYKNWETIPGTHKPILNYCLDLDLALELAASPICNGISNGESCNFSHVKKGDVVSYYILYIVNFVEPFLMANIFFLYTVFTHECFNLREICLITMESNIECTLI